MRAAVNTLPWPPHPIPSLSPYASARGPSRPRRPAIPCSDHCTHQCPLQQRQRLRHGTTGRFLPGCRRVPVGVARRWVAAPTCIYSVEAGVAAGSGPKRLDDRALSALANSRGSFRDGLLARRAGHCPGGFPSEDRAEKSGPGKKDCGVDRGKEYQYRGHPPTPPPHLSSSRTVPAYHRCWKPLVPRWRRGDDGA